MKQAIVVRSDLEMSAGKLAAQVAHGALLAYENTPAEVRDEWKSSGQKKVVLRATSELDLHALADQAKRANLPFAMVQDAGRTQLDPGTVTALAIGPAPDDEIDRITGELSTY